MMISIPPKYAVSQVVGFIKGKSAIHLARTYGERKRNFVGQSLANDAEAYRGRKPSFSRRQLDEVQVLISAGTMTVSEIARHVGLQRMAVARIKADPAAAEAMLAKWDPVKTVSVAPAGPVETQAGAVGFDHRSAAAR
jgi:glycine cleavage system aminomethyltransferase T